MKDKLYFNESWNSSTLLSYWDKTLICKYANKAFVNWFDIDPTNTVDKVYLKEILENVYEKNQYHIKEVLKGKIQVFELDLINRVGQLKNTIATYRPDFDNGIVIGFTMHVADITKTSFPHNKEKIENIKSEKETTENETPLKKVIEVLKSRLTTGFPGIPELSRLCFISESKLKRDFKAAYTKTLFEYYRHLQMQLADTYFKEQKYSKKQLAVIFDFSNPSNFSIRYNKYLKEQELIHPSKNSVKNNNDRYKTIISQAPFSIAMVDQNLIFQATSQKFIDIHNLGENAIIGKYLYSVFPKNTLTFKKINQVVLNGETISGEEAVINSKTGQIQHIKWNKLPWTDDDGKIGGIFFYTEDITSTKIIQSEHQDNVFRSNKVSESIKIGIWSFQNNEGKWDKIMREITEVTDGYTPKDAAIPLSFFTKGESLNKMKTAYHEAITLGKSFDLIVELITAKNNLKSVRIIGYSELKANKYERQFGVLMEIL